MWLCPTFQRPERLAELALSWEECEPGTPLMVRIWDQDPRREDYFSIQWPDSWTLYESPAKGAGEALNELFRLYPNEPGYGFVGDDIVLRTPGGMALLEMQAGEWGVTYPNDVFQRYRLPTHFYVGGEYARTLGSVVPPMFKHNYMDVGLAQVAESLRLLRYCPEVVFQHRHFLVEDYGIAKDASYATVYPEGTVPSGEYEEYGQHALALFESTYRVQACQRLMKAFTERYEVWDLWEQADGAIHRRAG